MVLLVSLTMVFIFFVYIWVLAPFIAILNSIGVFSILRVQLSSQCFPIMWVDSCSGEFDGVIILLFLRDVLCDISGVHRLPCLWDPRDLFVFNGFPRGSDW